MRCPSGEEGKSSCALRKATIQQRGGTEGGGNVDFVRRNPFRKRVIYMQTYGGKRAALLEREEKGGSFDDVGQQGSIKKKS